MQENWGQGKLGTDGTFTPDQHVEAVTRGEASGIEFELMFGDASSQVAGEADVKLARLVRHDVSPITFHDESGFYHLESSGADPSHPHPCLWKTETVHMCSVRDGTSREEAG